MITCIIKDASGAELGTFQPAGQENILDEAAAAGIEIPYSCHAGACTTCAMKVLQGMEMFDQEKDGPKYLETDDDVVLTCIGGVKEEFVNDSEHTLELQMVA